MSIITKTTIGIYNSLIRWILIPVNAHKCKRSKAPHHFNIMCGRCTKPSKTNRYKVTATLGSSEVNGLRFLGSTPKGVNSFNETLLINQYHNVKLDIGAQCKILSKQICKAAQANNKLDIIYQATLKCEVTAMETNISFKIVDCDPILGAQRAKFIA